jgi:hypothetical protein
MTDREVMQQALEALETKGEHHSRVYAAINALRTALEQPEQEPVAIDGNTGADVVERLKTYTTPPAAQRPWVGLTDDDLEFWTEELGQGELGRGVIRAVVDHLKEKNT